MTKIKYETTVAKQDESELGRVRAELDELNDKRRKLNRFIHSKDGKFKSLPFQEQDLLRVQMGNMQRYAETLLERTIVMQDDD